MTLEQQEDRETIAELLARLIDSGRVVVKAELAMFRTDFYRRIARARTGALLLLVGLIMGQAAAVTFLVTLSFVLQPWVGRLGGAAISVALGLGIAIFSIRAGIRKLMLVVEDPDDDELASGPAGDASPLDELFDRVRQRSQFARNELADAVGEAQARLHPQALLADLADIAVDHVQQLSRKALDEVKRRPARLAAIALAVILVVARPPLRRVVTGLLRATRRGSTSLKDDPSGRLAGRRDKETNG